MANLEERLEEQRQIQYEIKQTLDSPGWKRINDHFMKMKMFRRNRIFSMEKGSLDQLIDVGQESSELAGIELAIAFPHIIAEEARMEELAILEEMENENEVE